jgi:hypothetical protein
LISDLLSVIGFLFDSVSAFRPSLLVSTRSLTFVALAIGGCAAETIHQHLLGGSHCEFLTTERGSHLNRVYSLNDVRTPETKASI